MSRRAQLKEARTAVLSRLRDDGYTMPEAADALGVPYTIFRKMCVRCGLRSGWVRKSPRRGTGWHTRHEEYLGCLNAGMTASQTANHLGVTKQAVSQWAISTGSFFKKPSEIRREIQNKIKGTQ